VVTSVMPTAEIIKILDEVKDFKSVVIPNYWTEPLVVKSFKEVAREAKMRGVPVAINTNGLLITEDMAEFLVDHKTAVSVSIDATTSETLVKTRSTNRLERIHNAVFLLLEKRGERASPRVVVSFTAEDCNRHEQEEFLRYWIQYVDAVRINEMYTYERTIDNVVVTRDRTPCREIYDQMIIDFNGDVRMCCVDGFRVTSLGNVFEHGVYNVWHGEALTAVRKSHEDRNYGDQPFCRSCTLWSNYNVINEHEEGNLLIRSSDSTTYYNRLDRMNHWKEELRRNDLEFLPGGT
jgi:radical SAM protein with 4Fe4S-binding SPASM domain